jgi:hypothetical protein
MPELQSPTGTIIIQEFQRGLGIWVEMTPPPHYIFFVPDNTPPEQCFETTDQWDQKLFTDPLPAPPPWHYPVGGIGEAWRRMPAAQEAVGWSITGQERVVSGQFFASVAAYTVEFESRRFVVARGAPINPPITEPPAEPESPPAPTPEEPPAPEPLPPMPPAPPVEPRPAPPAGGISIRVVNMPLLLLLEPPLRDPPGFFNLHDVARFQFEADGRATMWLKITDIEVSETGGAQTHTLSGASRIVLTPDEAREIWAFARLIGYRLPLEAACS